MQKIAQQHKKKEKSCLCCCDGYDNCDGSLTKNICQSHRTVRNDFVVNFEFFQIISIIKRKKKYEKF